MDICQQGLKESTTKVGSTATVSGTVYCAYPILPFGIVACTFFPTTFLEIAVYTISNYNRKSNEQVFFSLEFVNILLQIEAKAVKNASLLL